MSSVGRRFVSSGSTFEAQIGYSRAVVTGDWVFVSGTTGYDYETMTLPEGVLEQTEQCLRNIATALERAGSSLDEVVRVTYLVPNGDDFEACWPALREAFGVARPAATMMAVALMDPKMKIEIEVTALLGSAAVA
jgi:enamine deaminase RidA (YjgF/YER057c/UK114 family)